MPFFSVIIPCYNREDLIAGAVTSVLNQNFKDFEILVIDDASTDQTVGRLNKDFSGHSNLRILAHEENRERGAARNTGIREADGKYLVFLDSDDEWKENHLSVLRATINKFRGHYLFATKYRLRDEAGKISTNKDLDLLKSGYQGYQIFLKGNPIGCNICVKNDFQSLTKFEESTHVSGLEDWIFLFLNTYRHGIIVADEITVVMSDHSKRSMRDYDFPVINNRLSATSIIDEALNLPSSESRFLWASSFFFNSIHALIRDNKKDAFKYLRKSIEFGKRDLEVAKLSLKVALA